MPTRLGCQAGWVGLGGKASCYLKTLGRMGPAAPQIGPVLSVLSIPESMSQELRRIVTPWDDFSVHFFCQFPGSARVSPEPLQRGGAGRRSARQLPAVCGATFLEKRRLGPTAKAEPSCPLIRISGFLD